MKRLDSGRRGTLVLVPLFLAPLVAGCSYDNYVAQRGNDFADMWRFNLSGLGPGVTVNARATRFLQAGGGYDGFLPGSKEGLGTWRAGILGRYAGIWRTNSVEYGLGPLYHVEYSQLPVHGNIRHAGSPGRWGEDYRTADEFGFTVHLGIVGVDAAFRPLEFFDFMLGWISVDPMEDDMRFDEPANRPEDPEVAPMNPPVAGRPLAGN